MYKVTRFIVCSVLLVLLVLPAYNLLSVQFEQPSNPVPALVAHRGSAGLAPENTLPAIDSGIAFNAGFIEIDIRQTLDGEIILMHDKTVNRTTNGEGLVHQLTYKQLSVFNAAGKFSDAFVRVPLLKEVLQKIVPGRSMLIIEIKDPGLYPGLVTRLASLVSQMKAGQKVMVFSFDKHVIKEVKQKMPGVKTGIFCSGHEDIHGFPASDYVCPGFWSVLYAPAIIGKIHRTGRKVFVWNVNAGFLMRYLQGKKVDGVITDRPDVYWKVFF
jgi:glycerophosphoryl diester phosphodiesterase